MGEIPHGEARFARAYGRSTATTGLINAAMLDSSTVKPTIKAGLRPYAVQRRRLMKPVLDFERFPMAFRVVALAGQFGCLLRIGTYIAAVILSGRSRTVASRVFAFLCRGHESSSQLNMPSHFRRLRPTLRQLHTRRCNYLSRFAHFEKYGSAIRRTISLQPYLCKTAQISHLCGWILFESVPPFAVEAATSISRGTIHFFG